MERLGSLGLACFGRSDFSAPAVPSTPSAAAIIELARTALQSKSARSMNEACEHIESRLAMARGVSARQRSELTGLNTHLRAAVARLRAAAAVKAGKSAMPSASRASSPLGLGSAPAVDETRALLAKQAQTAARQRLQVLDAHNADLRRQIAGLQIQNTSRPPLWQYLLRLRNPAPTTPSQT